MLKIGYWTFKRLGLFVNFIKWISELILTLYVNQHASEGVEKILIGNKCEMENNRQVPQEKAVAVSCTYLINKIINYIPIDIFRLQKRMECGLSKLQQSLILMWMKRFDICQM